MVNYQCERCGYQTNDKNRYDKHINRKFQCKVVTLKSLGEAVGSKNDPIESKNDPVGSKNDPFESGIDNKDKLDCMFCGKVFKHKTNLIRHQKYRCQVVNKEMNQLEILKKEAQDIKDELEDNIKMKKIQMKQMTKNYRNRTKKLMASNQNNYNTNNINNTQNLNSHNTINITLNNFGNENVDHITTDKLLGLSKFPYSAIPKLITEKYFNMDKPENHNIRKTNKKDNFVEVYKDDQWQIENAKKLTDDLADINISYFEMLDNINMRFNQYIEKYYDDNSGVKEDLKSDILLVLLNGTNKIMKELKTGD